MEYAAPNAHPILLDRLPIADPDIFAIADYWRTQSDGIFTADLVVRATGPYERAARLADERDALAGIAADSEAGAHWTQLNVPGQ
jgi:hypothetical protein